MALRPCSRDQEMDGKSIMGLLLLTAAQGTSVTISADGVDEIDAIATLALVERGFNKRPHAPERAGEFLRASGSDGRWC